MPEATKITEWCGARGWTMTNAADLAGYSVSHLCLIANGKRPASPEAKVRIARALGARVADLFPGVALIEADAGLDPADVAELGLDASGLMDAGAGGGLEIGGHAT